jgi:Ca-activated chloride channel family protein
MKMGENYYTILGVDSTSTPEQIRKAYIDLARKYHPDATSKSPNPDLFILIQKAYEVLSNTQTRVEYDKTLFQQVSSKPPIDIKWIFSQKEIQRLQEPQVIYGRLDIKYSGDLEKFKSPPSHLCIVLDRSTSMKGERIDAVRENLRQLISVLRNVDLISIITFNDKAEVLIAPTSTMDKNSLFAKIDTIQAAGGTEMYRGLKAGVDMLWQGQSSSYLPNLLLLTDGNTYGDEERCVELARKATEKNSRISALGFGTDWNDNFLDSLTSITGGCSYYVKDLFDLPRFLLLTLTSMKTTIAHNINLEKNGVENADILFCYKIEPETIKLQTSDPIQLGSLLKEKQSTYMIAFEVPQIPSKKGEYLLFNGKIRFLLGENRDNSFVENIKLTLPVVDKVSKNTIPLEIVQALSRITLYQMQEKSHSDVQSGNVIDAVRRLTYMATHLISQGNIPFAKEVLNEAENIKKEQAYSEDGIKRLKYGTRALLQLPEPEKRIS